MSDVEVALLKAVFPTVQSVGSLLEVAQGEFDVLITRRGVSGAAPHLFILAICGEVKGTTLDLGSAHHSEASYVNVSYSGSSRARQFHIPEDLPVAVDRLARNVLAPAAAEKPAHLLITATGHNPPTARFASPLTGVIRPFLVTSEGGPVAGRFRRDGDLAECWGLPQYIQDLVPWALAAREVWQDLAPDRFPRPDPWRRRVEWRTPAEVALLEERQQLEKERNQYLAEMERKETGIEARLDAATATADARERALLTAQGPDLKDAVITALRHFGYEVEDMDLKAKPGQEREDLRVRRPGGADWVAIVEVRGNKKGAEFNDLMRMHKFLRMFEREESRSPDAQWYIANHFIEQDPDKRDAVFAGHPAEIQTFGEEDGLVIDTIDLFKAWIGVLSGVTSAESVRSALTNGKGRFLPNAIATGVDREVPKPNGKVRR